MSDDEVPKKKRGRGPKPPGLPDGRTKKGKDVASVSKTRQRLVSVTEEVRRGRSQKEEAPKDVKKPNKTNKATKPKEEIKKKAESEDTESEDDPPIKGDEEDESEVDESENDDEGENKSESEDDLI